MLHKDLFYEISFYCKPYLFSVNKELHSFYNDDWFKMNLENKYPRKKLFTTTNYLDLYKKSLLEGDIYYVNNSLISKLKIKGIKAQYYNKYYANHWRADDYILTFNGELYYQNNNNTTLIDTEVIDISSEGYIKKNKVYFFYTDDTTKELLFKENLLRIVSRHEQVYILSVNGLYIKDGLGLHFYEMKYCIDIFVSDNMYVINKNNEYFTFVSGKFKVCFPENKYLSSKNMKRLFIGRGYILLSDGIVTLHNKEIDKNVKNIIVDSDNNVNWYYIK